MSRRKKHKKHEDHPNHEAWVIPYADLLTLLLALFVVLYAMSSVNTTKYRALAQAISSAFNGTRAVIQPVTPTSPNSSAPVPSSKPSPMPRTPLAHVLLPVLTQQIAPPQPSVQSPAEQDKNKLSEQQQNLERIRNQVEHALQPLIDKNLVVVRRTPNWLEIELRTDILFPSGVATLSSNANQILSNLGGILAPFDNPLRVEGYTDDVPIQTQLYPSNWELSAARAASVARLFADHGVDPSRLGIVGWGQYRPAAGNDNEDGRNKNRRVLVVVLSDKAAPTRFYNNGAQTADADPSQANSTADASQPPAANALPAAVTQAVAAANAQLGNAPTNTAAAPNAVTANSAAAAPTAAANNGPIQLSAPIQLPPAITPVSAAPIASAHTTPSVTAARQGALP